MNSRSSVRSCRIAAISSTGLNPPASSRATVSDRWTVSPACSVASRNARWEPSCPMWMSFKRCGANRSERLVKASRERGPDRVACDAGLQRADDETMPAQTTLKRRSKMDRSNSASNGVSAIVLSAFRLRTPSGALASRVRVRVSFEIPHPGRWRHQLQNRRCVHRSRSRHARRRHLRLPHIGHGRRDPRDARISDVFCITADRRPESACPL